MTISAEGAAQTVWRMATRDLAMPAVWSASGMGHAGNHGNTKMMIKTDRWDTMLFFKNWNS